MDRSSRRTTSRRPSQANSTSPPPSADDPLFGHRSPMSPVKSHSWHQSSPQMASQSARRDSRPSSHHEFTFSTPDGHREQGLRKKSKPADGSAESPAAATPNDADAEDAATKGGHSLRRRTRVNYASEQIEDEPTVPSSSSAARLKRRRTDGVQEDSPEDISAGGRPKRRGASLGMETPSSRRRNPSRKSVESRAYIEEFDNDENAVRGAVDDVVRDTIQVGNWSSNSSSPSSKSEKLANALPTSGQILSHQNHADADSLADLSNPAVPKRESSPLANVLVAEAAPDDPYPSNGVEGDDPSQQLHVESIESQFGMGGSDFVAESNSPPKTPSQQKAGIITHSPVPVEQGSPMVVDFKDAVDPALEGQRVETPLHVDPSLMDPQLMAIDPALSAPSETIEAAKGEEKPVPSPEPVAEEPVDKEAPPSEGSKTDEPEDTAAIKEDSVADSENITKSTEDEPTEAEFPASETIEIEKPAYEPVSSTPLKEEVLAGKPESSVDPKWCRPQPTPAGKWSHLTPYVNGEYCVYPERKPRSDNDDASEDQSPEDKDSNKESNDLDNDADDNDDVPDIVTELPTPAPGTPTRGSPVPEPLDLAGLNSPGPAGEEAGDQDISESQEQPERKKHYRYRKLRDPEDFVTAIEKYEEMSTEELYDLLQAVNVSLTGWQEEWTAQGRIVDDYENASRRRIADAKYETRTRNLHQHGLNHEEPEFGVRGYKAKEKETMSETRYLQGQDRIMAAAYGFEYDPHPSKIGRQNPDTQQAGVTTRGRSLRNQPKQTAKATEADSGVAGKRQRKPVQLYDPAPQDVSRASTPVPMGRGGRRRRTTNVDGDGQGSFASSFNDMSDNEAPVPQPGPGRGRKRGPKPKAQRLAEEAAAANSTVQETPRTSGRRGRPPKVVPKEEDFASSQALEEPRSELRQHKGRHMLTLKIPKGKNLSEPSSAISDNGDSRPSTASSDSTQHTAESSYSFRPKRQKRFRDEPDENDGSVQAPPKKRTKRVGAADDGDDVMSAVEPAMQTTPQSNGGARKTPKIKVMRASQGQAAPESRNGTPATTPAAEGPDGEQKEYRAMTKSEKMSASMKNRWANGNMAGAVEKRKATLAAKKLAQAQAEQRVGFIAPKPKGKGRKEPAQMPGENPVFINSHPPAPRPHLHPHPHHHLGPPPPPPPPPGHHHLGQHHPQHQHQYQHHQQAQHQHPHQHHHGGPPPPPPPPHQMHPHPQHPHTHGHRPHPDYPGMGAPFPS